MLNAGTAGGAFPVNARTIEPAPKPTMNLDTSMVHFLASVPSMLCTKAYSTFPSSRAEMLYRNVLRYDVLVVR